jgi:hypothetical protein
MASGLSPQSILIVYWLIILVLAAFALRMACSLCRTGMPSWRRALVSVLVVTLLAYLTFDFTCYLIMRSMDEVLLRVPPGYTFGHWFREPMSLKWHIVSQAGPLKYLPFVFGLCVAGVLQVVILQGQVTFRFGMLILLLQWVATGVAGYIVALLMGVALTSMGWDPPQQTVQQGPRRTQANKRPSPKDPKAPGAAGEPSSLNIIGHDAAQAVKESRDYLVNATANLKAYANSYLDELKEAMAPLTRHLPQPVQRFLDEGGWWWVLGICAVLALLWLRALLGKLRKASRLFRRKRKTKRARVPSALGREDLHLLGAGFTDEGPHRLVIKGIPARLRLVVLSPGTQGGGELSEDMADRVLDWIKRGLAEVASHDDPGIRIWPPFPSAAGFAKAVQARVAVPESKGMKSHWVVLAGAVRMGRSIIRVGLALHAEDRNNLRFIEIKDERWLDFLTIEKTPDMIGAR